MSDLKSFLSRHLFFYDSDKLLEQIYKFNDKKTLPVSISNKKHLSYLEVYLSPEGLDAKFFLIEPTYINKDYLTDYSSYYSSCFEDYKKKSSRIHFFRYKNSNRRSFKKDLTKCFIPSNYEDCSFSANFFEENYIGCIVINPIPNTFLGFTLLKHYNIFKPHSKGRDFWGIKNYYIHLMGNEICIPTLAFHEQDNNVGACATVSIWSVFQKAAQDYYINLKSPIEITKDAGLISGDGQRILPNKGLVTQAICTALTRNNIVTEVRSLENYEDSISYLCRLIYAYSALEIPIILLLQVPEGGGFDGHAVAVCGHRLTPEKKVNLNKEFISQADFMTQIYCHDDQWGPFVSMLFPDFNEESVDFFSDYYPELQAYKRENPKQYPEFEQRYKTRLIDSTWTETVIPGTEALYKYKYFLTPKESERKDLEKIYSILQFVIVPTFPKVRISYDTIESIVLDINKLIRDGLRLKRDSLKYLNWDIRVRYSEDFKYDISNLIYADISTGDDYNGFTIEQFQDFKFNILSQSLPKFIWVTTLQFENKPFITFLFDATGLVDCQLLLHALFYVPSMKKAFNQWIQEWIEVHKDSVNYSLIFHEFNYSLSQPRKDFFI